MSGILFAVGVVVAVFVGANIGGSSTGVAFGPAVGSRSISKTGAAALMTVFVMLGGWFIGRNVVATLGGQLVPADAFTLPVSVAILGFIGGALLIGNLGGVPASTSMTAVGAIAGLGLATGRLDWAVTGRIVAWWIVSPVIAFWVSSVIGRYAYPWLAERFAIARSDGPLIRLDRTGSVPRPVVGPDTTRRELVGAFLVIGISCYMAFSAGASNVANAVAPLVGNGALSASHGVILAAAAMGLGAFTLARRTMDTVGNDLTALPITAALVVATVASSIVTFLSWLGIPASFVVIATMSIIGLGWGRATRTTTVADAATGDTPDVSVGALTLEDTPTVGGDQAEAEPGHAAIGEETDTTTPEASALFDPSSTARVILLQNAVPVLATVTAYTVFRAAAAVGAL